jgi:hypothetical protein
MPLITLKFFQKQSNICKKINVKLILCPKCQDVVKGDYKPRTCKCGASGVQYTDDLNAIYWGEAIPLGFANSSLCEAVAYQPLGGMGRKFTAFVIPIVCPTFKLTKLKTEV